VVGYANDGLKIYCFVSRLSQKFANIARDRRVSATIANDSLDPMTIKGLSLGGRASPVSQDYEYERATEIFMKRHPEYARWPKPNPAFSPLLRITPTIISVLDYSKGFGHSDLVTAEEGDLRSGAVQKHDWFGQAA
jgi:nitroimidazol reductase NimA-like FMN-containing flavoprotein (pyridoxamine 5'-phosphate oxidase superfamily)